jgi:hypothetical protein
MKTLTLLTKINSRRQMKQLDQILKAEFEGLEVDTKILGTVGERWAQLALVGEDENIATSYILKEIGVCPTNIEKISGIPVLKGFIGDFEQGAEALSVDVGILKPKVIRATLSLDHLQTSLLEGKKMGLERIVKLFGLCPGLPINIRTVRFNEERALIEAELAEEQKHIYCNWLESLLDRLIVLGSPLSEIINTLKHSKLERDIIDVEPLGIFEHVLICKLGTDAAGLVPRIGRKLRKAKFAVFNPKRLRKVLA